jgi:small nuclear ribonucleoprotein (snRNP)-like protein
MKKLFTLAITCFLVTALAVRPVAAASKADKQLRFANKVKTELAKLGSGPQTRVEVKLRDKTRLKGYVSAIDENAFAVTDVKTGMATNVTYGEVAQIKGNNMSTGAKIALGVGIAAVVLLIIMLSALASD